MPTRGVTANSGPKTSAASSPPSIIRVLRGVFTFRGTLWLEEAARPEVPETAVVSEARLAIDDKSVALLAALSEAGAQSTLDGADVVGIMVGRTSRYSS